MRKLLGWLYAHRSVEEIIFSCILIAGIPYFVTNEIIDLLTNRSWTIGIINSFLILTIIYLLRKSIRGTLTKVHIFIFCLMLCIGFALFWPASTGLAGAGAYVLQSLIVILLLVNTGKAKAFFAIFLLAMVMIAGFADIEYKGLIVYKSQLVSFILNTVIIALVMILFRIAMARERRKLIFRINKLDRINREIEEKNHALRKNQEEIINIQTQLQQIIQDRTRDIEKENERIIRYAFINAHVIRGPLSTMLGLGDLMESSHPDFKLFKEKLTSMDQTVRKIGGILSIKTD